MLGQRDNSGSNWVIGLVIAVLVLGGAGWLYIQQPTILDSLPVVKGEPDPAEEVDDEQNILNEDVGDRPDTSGQSVETSGDTSYEQLSKYGKASTHFEFWWLNAKGEKVPGSEITVDAMENIRGSAVSGTAQGYLQISAKFSATSVESVENVRIHVSVRERDANVLIYEETMTPDVQHTGVYMFEFETLTKIPLSGALAMDGEHIVTTVAKVVINGYEVEFCHDAGKKLYDLVIEKSGPRWNLDWQRKIGT